MSQSGARGPAAPPKPPAAPAAKVASPASPPVAPKVGVPPRAPGQVSPATVAAKPAGSAPMRPRAPSAPQVVDVDDWDGTATTEQRAAAVLPPEVAAALAPSPPAAVAPPAQPAPAPPAAPAIHPSPVLTPTAPAAIAAPTPPPPQAAAHPPPPVSAADVLLVVREMLEHATEPLKARILDLERRLAAQPPGAPLGLTPTAPIVSRLAPTAGVPVVQLATEPGAAAARPSYVPVPRAPLLDVAAIERDVTLDPDMRGFDGRARRRRMTIVFTLGLLIVFGGLFAMLAESYTHAHP